MPLGFVFTKLLIHKRTTTRDSIAQFARPTKSPMRAIRPLSDQRSNALSIGPQLVFAAAIFAGLAAWIVLTMTLKADLVVPLIASLSFVFAAALAVVAWRGGAENPACFSYADVAGALTLIGLCIAATIEPEQVARLMASDPTQP